MEITSGTLSRDEGLQGIWQAVEFLRSIGVDEILVAYGWDCDCPDEQRFQDVVIPLNQFKAFIEESEGADYYHVGENDLHVKDPAGRCAFLFCHEADIHFITEDEALFGRLRANWLANEYSDMHEKRGSDWQRVVSNP
jgi:hypothetical protein